MSDTLEAVPVGPDEITQIAAEVWSSFLGLELVPTTDDGVVPPWSVMSAVVRITGEWNGAVVLECSKAHAVAAAALMFTVPHVEVTLAQACDALGELGNIVAGNLKSLLPAPSVLSLPSTGHRDTEVLRAGARLVHRVVFTAALGVLHVSLWEDS